MTVPQLKEKIILTKEQKEVLDGALLGDGCLCLHKGGINAQFSYLSKSKQHVEYVGKYFKEYWSGEGIKEYSYLDTRTNKEYFHSKVRTYTNETFTEEYNRWYKNKIKHLPEDLTLTPLVCLIWYIGDGGICHSDRTEYIKLSTHCFLKEEQEKILLPQLVQFEASLVKADHNQYFIYIPHRKEQDFLDYIGECPFEDYEYKWKIKKYKNAIPKNHTDNEQIFCELYTKGINYYQIAKQFDIEPNAVKYYLIKNNLYIPPNKKIKNSIIAYKNNEPIQIFSSGAEASRQLKMSASGISQVISGKRNSAGGFQWKKYLDLNEKEKQEIEIKFKDYFN